MFIAAHNNSRQVRSSGITRERTKYGRALRPSKVVTAILSAAMLGLFALVTVALGQPAPESLSSKQPQAQPDNFYVIKKRLDDQFEAARKQKSDKPTDEEEEGTGYGPFQEWSGNWQRKLFPHGNFTTAYRAMNRIVREPHPPAAPPRSGSCSGWTELGPFDMPLGTSTQRGVGRVNWIDFDPANANNIFTGSAKGGLFYSTNASSPSITWQSGGTDFFLPNIGAAHVAVDPTNGDRWFLATGDGDGLNGNAWNVSHGVYRTPDHGQSWDKIGLDFSNSNSWDFQIKKLVIAPNNSAMIYAATSIGLYRTTNALDSNPANVNWTPQPTGVNNNLGPFYDVVYKPGSTTTIYASGITVVRSTNSGATWNSLPGIPFLGTDVLRVAMEVTPANPDYLYVIVVEKGPAACNGSVNSSRLYRFDANTGVWTDKGPICNTGSYGSDQRGVHSSRAHSIGVSPTNADLIYIADVSPVAKCTSGGSAGFCSWIQTSNTVHADIHQVKVTPDGLEIYAASDGGVFKSSDGGATWTPQNNGLHISTALRMSTAATDPSLILKGLFDNGSVLYKNGAWKHVYGGDGLTPIIDHIDPSHMYVSAQGGAMARSDDGGNTFTSINLPCSNWFTYAVLNSSNPATVFGACHPEVMRSTNRGGNWVAISSFGSQGMAGYEVWKIYTAPSNPDYVYVHLVSGTGPQLLMRTTNANDPNPANVVWTTIGHPSAQWISDVDVDEADPSKFWLTYSGFSPNTEKVYYYDGTWTNLTSDLSISNLAVNSIVHERGSNRLFIGTHIGVYTGNYSPNGTLPTWTRVGAPMVGGLPYVEVNEVEINYVNNKLRAATFGRGAWEISLDPCLPTVAGPDAIIKDSADDVGNEPNTDSGNVLWASEDIWVRNSPDHMFTYSPTPPALFP